MSYVVALMICRDLNPNNNQYNAFLQYDLNRMLSKTNIKNVFPVK